MTWYESYELIRINDSICVTSKLYLINTSSLHLYYLSSQVWTCDVPDSTYNPSHCFFSHKELWKLLFTEDPYSHSNVLGNTPGDTISMLSQRCLTCGQICPSILTSSPSRRTSYQNSIFETEWWPYSCSRKSLALHNGDSNHASKKWHAQRCITMWDHSKCMPGK